VNYSGRVQGGEDPAQFPGKGQGAGIGGGGGTAPRVLVIYGEDAVLVFLKELRTFRVP